MERGKKKKRSQNYKECGEKRYQNKFKLPHNYNQSAPFGTYFSEDNFCLFQKATPYQGSLLFHFLCVHCTQCCKQRVQVQPHWQIMVCTTLEIIGCAFLLVHGYTLSSIPPIRCMMKDFISQSQAKFGLDLKRKVTNIACSVYEVQIVL